MIKFSCQPPHARFAEIHKGHQMLAKQEKPSLKSQEKMLRVSLNSLSYLFYFDHRILTKWLRSIVASSTHRKSCIAEHLSNQDLVFGI